MPHAAPSVTVTGPTPKRTAPRTNLFLMATMVIDGASLPVRVRNLSASGALIEATWLPPTGTGLVLRRADLTAEAQLMWVAGGRGGVKFAAPINLARWIPLPSVQGQAQVDQLIAETRTDLSDRPTAVTAPVAAGDARLLGRIAEELALVARRLEALGYDLKGEPTIMVRHSVRLQEIDLSVQTLAHVGRLLTSDNPAAVLREIGMADLRRRLERAAPL